MDTKEEFKKLIEEICDVVFQESAKPKGSKFEIPLITKNILYMLMNLNQQIEEQREQINKFEEQIKKLEGKINTLIKELKTLGYLNIKERRKPLKRTIVTQEAFNNVLKSKGIIRRKEMLCSIREDRVRLSGACRFYLNGSITVPITPADRLPLSFDAPYTRKTI